MLEISKARLRQIRLAKPNGRRDFATFDEHWIYCYADDESVWLSANEKTPERTRKMITPPKLMLTIVWNPAKFHVVGLLPKAKKFWSPHYVSHITNRLLAAVEPINSIRPGNSLSILMTLASSRKRGCMTISRLTASGGRIIRRIHRIWHHPISFCLSLLRDSGRGRIFLMDKR
jgi:hypothetical protein